MTSFYSQRVLTDFFKLFKSNECLWNMKSPSYHNKKQRRLAMNVLVTKYRELQPDANEEFVRKKINNFRTSYKREAKLVKKSKESRGSGEEIYEPRLWYFNLLTFLDGQDPPNASSDASDEKEVADHAYAQPTFSTSDGDLDSTQFSERSFAGNLDPLLDDKTPPRSIKRSRSDTETPVEIPKTICDQDQDYHQKNNQQKDRFDVYGEYVAFKLRFLAHDQRVMAEKLINDVLFEAECNNLDRQWKCTKHKNV